MRLVASHLHTYLAKSPETCLHHQSNLNDNLLRYCAVMGCDGLASFPSHACLCIVFGLHPSSAAIQAGLDGLQAQGGASYAAVT